MIHRAKGFTAVELLVAMVIGVLLLGSAYQLYTAVVRDSGAAQQRAVANTYAYTLLRQTQKNSNAIRPLCVASSSTPAIPASVGISSQSTATVAVDCPFGTSSAMSRITVTITYFTPTQGSVVRAINVHL